MDGCKSIDEGIKHAQKELSPGKRKDGEVVKNTSKLSKRNERARIGVETLQEEMEDNGQMSEEVQNEVELELKIGDGAATNHRP